MAYWPTVSYIHGDMTQDERDDIMRDFRTGETRVLITTDLLARGIDIQGVSLVINYDLPQVPEDYIHRIGRTARAGSEGSAITFLTRDDRTMWRSISKLIDPNYKEEFNYNKKNQRSNKRNNKDYNKKRKFNFKKGKKKFFKRDDFRTPTYTNNPKYFGKERTDNSSTDGERKKFNLFISCGF